MKTSLLFAPFLFFLVGFYGASLLVQQTPFDTPALIGLPVAEAVTLLSEKELNARILAKKEKPDVEPGTVIEQVPHAGQRIKPHQSVFLVVAKQPQKLQTPLFTGLSLSEAQKEADSKRIRLKIWMIPDIAPHDTVISQWPRPEKELETLQATLYVSEGTMSAIRLVPDFKGIPLADAESRLKREGINVSSFSNTNRPANEIIIQSQKPLPGSIVDLSKSVSVQLQG